MTRSEKYLTILTLLTEVNKLANELGLNCQEMLSDVQDEIAICQQAEEEDDVLKFVKSKDES